MTSRRGFLQTLGGAALAGCGKSKGRPPNLILFVADDLGWADLGCYGNRFHETPHLDSLAARGMRFQQAYAASPVCSPTRASIMTGRHPARLRITNWLPGPHQFPHSKLIPPANLRTHLPLAATTLAEMLKKSGYATAHVGKWHLGGEGFLPEQQGFDFNAGGGEWGAPASYFYPAWGERPKLAARPGDYLNDRLTEEALGFLDRRGREPFFLHFAFYDVHIPLEAREERARYFAAKLRPQDRARNATYAAMLAAVDDSVGKVREKLRALGVAERTLIAFTSDNGGLHVPESRCAIATSNAPLRAGKGHLYEGGIRVPLLVEWPGVTRAGSVSDVPVMSTDFFATFGEIVETSVRIPRDSVSLTPLLRGGTSLPRQELFWHYPHYSNQGGRPAAAVRQGRFKLVRFFEDQRSELYDLAADPGEVVSLANQNRPLASRLLLRLNGWMEEVGAPLMERNPDYDPRVPVELPWQRNCPAS